MSTDTNTFSRRVWWAVRPLWYWRLLRLFLRSCWISVAVGVAGWQISHATGWPLMVAADLAETPPPNASELAALRALNERTRRAHGGE